MSCRDFQTSFSLYLYGELDFAQEEALESHLAQCAACQLSLAREKEWHTLAKAQAAEPPLDLLAECRQQLRPALAREAAAAAGGATPATANVRSWWRWANPFDITTTRWSTQLAAASLLVALGFVAARWMDRHSLVASGSGVNQMGLLNPLQMHVRDIQTNDAGLVRILGEQEVEITGNLQDSHIRSLLLSGTREAEPAVRFYSVRILTQPNVPGSDDLRQALFEAARLDPNPAVRLEAMNGLTRYTGDPAALETFKFILQHDENPGVRDQAINILVPPGRAVPADPAVTRLLQDVLVSSPEDDYVRARCAQVLQEAKVAVVY